MHSLIGTYKGVRSGPRALTTSAATSAASSMDQPPVAEATDAARTIAMPELPPLPPPLCIDMLSGLPASRPVSGAHQLSNDADFWERHEELCVLGKGYFGKGVLARESATGRLAAVKIVYTVRAPSTAPAPAAAEVSTSSTARAVTLAPLELSHLLPAFRRYRISTAMSITGASPRSSARSITPTLCN